MSIGSRIKLRREELGLTQPELAKLVGVSKGSIGNYESEISSPNENILIKLFSALDCDANYLYYDDINKTNDILSGAELAHIKKYRTLDEYGKELVTAVIDIEYKRCTYKPEPNRDELIEISINYAPVSAGLGDELEDYEHWEKVSVPLTPESRKADFILRVDGDSMEPKFSNGDYLLVRKQPAVDIGQIGIFDVDGKGYVKKYGGDKLISLNPKYKDISTTDDSRCFGLVLGTTEIVDE